MLHSVRATMLEAHLCHTDDIAINLAISVALRNDNKLFMFVSNVLPSLPLPPSPILFAPSPTLTTQLPTTTPLCDVVEIQNEGGAYQLSGERKKKKEKAQIVIPSPSIFSPLIFNFFPFNHYPNPYFSPFYLHYFITSFTHFIYFFFYLIFFFALLSLEGVC
jgi:hypothetical protein